MATDLMTQPLYRDIVIDSRAKLRMAYDLMADIRNLSVCREVREIVGQDDAELEAACTWLKRRMRSIECAIGNPLCLECGCQLETSESACTVCQWQAA